MGGTNYERSENGSNINIKQELNYKVYTVKYKRMLALAKQEWSKRYSKDGPEEKMLIAINNIRISFLDQILNDSNK